MSQPQSIYPVGTVCCVVESFTPSAFDELELHPDDIVVIEPMDEQELQCVKPGYIKVFEGMT
jgi:hypothetical protein